VALSDEQLSLVDDLERDRANDKAMVHEANKCHGFTPFTAKCMLSFFFPQFSLKSRHACCWVLFLTKVDDFF